ncbi:MAG: Rieske 2Fe-2S domain-containing protein [Gammaproteobacteria bacterium]|nr:Rieske 2Fe-2S domain-containing protein [Gammaproteobacteria bacterium]
MVEQVIIAIDELTDSGAKSFVVSSLEGEIEGFVIYFSGEVRAYQNSCPHTGVTLNWSDNQFFDGDHNLIMCSLHGALFQPLDGYCVWGPCQGESLKSLPVELVGGQVVIYI